MRRSHGRKTGGSGLGTNSKNTKKQWVAQRHSQKLIRAVCETMEDRVMLNGTTKALVPTTITPSTVTQTLLGPGNITFTESSSSTTALTSQFYKFTVNNATAGQLTQFGTTEAT